MVFMVLVEMSLMFCGGGQVEKIDRVLSFNLSLYHVSTKVVMQGSHFL